MNADKIPRTAPRAPSVAESVANFLAEHSNLRLGCNTIDFYQERRHHLEVLGLHALASHDRSPIGRVEFEGVRGPFGTIPIRIIYPRAVISNNHSEKQKVAALVYMHGGGYTVGSVDEFENGLRILAEESGVIVGCIIRSFNEILANSLNRLLAWITTWPLNIIFPHNFKSTQPSSTGLKDLKVLCEGFILISYSAEVTPPAAT